MEEPWRTLVDLLEGYRCTRVHGREKKCRVMRGRGKGGGKGGDSGNGWGVAWGWGGMLHA